MLVPSAERETASKLFASAVPEGWRIVAEMAPGEFSGDNGFAAEIVELPAVEEIRDDLELMVAAWVEDLAPGKRVSPGALQLLGRLACGRGLDALGRTLVAAVAASDGTIEEEHPDVMDVVKVIHQSVAIPNDGVQYTSAMSREMRDVLNTAMLAIIATEEGEEAFDTAYSWTALDLHDDTFYDPFRQLLDAAGINAADLQ